MIIIQVVLWGPRKRNFQFDLRKKTCFKFRIQWYISICVGKEERCDWKTLFLFSIELILNKSRDQITTNYFMKLRFFSANMMIKIWWIIIRNIYFSGFCKIHQAPIIHPIGNQIQMSNKKTNSTNMTTFNEVKMFLKPVWVGKIHGVEVYATYVVRIWWFSNKFSIFQLKRM